VQPGVQPGAQGCGAEQGPCCAPGAVCRGRDSAACQAQHSACPGSCAGRCGETCGGKEPPAEQGRGLLLPQLLPGTGGSQLHCITECFQMHTVREETRQGRSFSCCLVREKDWRQKTKGTVDCEQISETPNLFLNQLLLLCTECAFSLSFLKGWNQLKSSLLSADMNNACMLHTGSFLSTKLKGTEFGLLGSK